MIKFTLILLLFLQVCNVCFGYINLNSKSIQFKRINRIKPLFDVYLEQFKEAREEEERDIREGAIRKIYTEELEKLTSGEGLSPKLLDNDFWMQFAEGSITIGKESEYYNSGKYKLNQKEFKDIDLEEYKTSLANRGFLDTGIDSKMNISWEDYDIIIDDITDTMQSLKDAGFPSSFIFMYDQPWRICRVLFDLMYPLLSIDGCEIELEASVAGWALEKPTIEALMQEARKEKVGGNFGVPHRDLAYDKCHLHDGSSSILSLWIPMTDANLENGCMYVIPREHDKMFDRCGLMDFEEHVSPFRNFPYQDIYPLPAAKGTPLIWHPNTIHWGSSCSAYATQPRRSIGVAFRLAEEKMKLTEKEKTHQLNIYGRVPFTKDEIEQGLSLPSRLQMCAQSVLMYSVWFPEFDGLDQNQFK